MHPTSTNRQAELRLPAPNYVFKPTAEQALRSFQSAARRRLNTALEITRIAVVKLVKCGKAGDESFVFVVHGVGWKLGMEVEA